MAAIFAYRCECCNEVHEGSPSFGFAAPAYYQWLTDEQKASCGWITDDLCTVTLEGRTDFFIRSVLEIPIHGISEPFIWGVWVSVSEKSYGRYVETRTAPADGDGFFGWLANDIPCYPPGGPFAVNVYLQPEGLRPIVELQQGGSEDHPLLTDQVRGIAPAKAQEIAELLLHPT
ncbi:MULTISPECIES: DUF2199 domain-containing protein [Pseudomonas]|uniref:DUF2199 domain-containing protein n=1 Tax=Pseudomonas auratipiscis TaxID=3115853 RepID=A0AB35WUP5_9PSED|nr:MULTISPECIES: DUF2199 domain-containing protein [unclassified Pseudomonas]MEE1866841.1 DUF2199 domain-containing protein [Pseudomonas sp. 120P]MEE1958737.1 DUF2199 domain-containing protein [Pseudomonas sp. 119P]